MSVRISDAARPDVVSHDVYVADRAPNAPGILIHIENYCPFDVWIHGAGNGGVLQPDNAQIKVNESRDYTAPDQWSAARVTASSAATPGSELDKVEMTLTNKIINYNVTYVDWVGLPVEMVSIGTGADCKRVGCYVPEAQILSGCPDGLLSGKRSPVRGQLLRQRGKPSKALLPRARREDRHVRRKRRRQVSRMRDWHYAAGLRVFGFLRRKSEVVLRFEPRDDRRPRQRRHQGLLPERSLQHVFEVGPLGVPRHLRVPLRRLWQDERERVSRVLGWQAAQHHLLSGWMTEKEGRRILGARRVSGMFQGREDGVPEVANRRGIGRYFHAGGTDCSRVLKNSFSPSFKGCEAADRCLTMSKTQKGRDERRWVTCSKKNRTTERESPWASPSSTWSLRKSLPRVALLDCAGSPWLSDRQTGVELGAVRWQDLRSRKVSPADESSRRRSADRHTHPPARLASPRLFSRSRSNRSGLRRRCPSEPLRCSHSPRVPS